MKLCNNCGSENMDQTNFCSKCGSSSFSTVPTVQPMVQPTTKRANGNVLAGLIGAFVFSIIGIAVYIMLHKEDVFAGICAIFIPLLSIVGYFLFAKPKGIFSNMGTMVAVLSTIFTVPFSVYSFFAFRLMDIFGEFSDEFTIFDAYEIAGDFIFEFGADEAFFEDLVSALIFSAIVVVINVVGTVFNKRKAK